MSCYFIKLTKAATGGVPSKKLYVTIWQFSQESPVLKSLLRRNWKLGLTACNFIKKRLQHRCFPVNIARFLLTPVLKNMCVRQLLKIIIKKDFLDKPPVTMIIYMINTGNQMLKISSSWPLTDPYLHRCFPIEAVIASLQTQKGLEVVFRLQFL